jgi:hypothetical protein
VDVVRPLEALIEPDGAPRPASIAAVGGLVATVTIDRWAAVAISLIALAVALYGAWERGQDRDRQQRRRLGENSSTH